MVLPFVIFILPPGPILHVQNNAQRRNYNGLTNGCLPQAEGSSERVIYGHRLSSGVAGAHVTVLAGFLQQEVGDR